MISGASSPTVSNAFVNNNSELCTLQISGTFTSATVNVEGIVDVNSGKWVTLATFDLSDLDLKTHGLSDKSIYQVGIAGILRVRISVTAISGGNITIMANFAGTSFSGKELPPSSEAPFTAYDLAVLGGYTGTQADYEAALADVVNVGPLAEQAAESAEDAAASAASASISAQTAQNAVSDISAEVVAQVTTQWLNENVDPVGSAVIVDSSLTISGAAADAKVTGDRVTELKKALTNEDFVNNIVLNKNYRYTGNTAHQWVPNSIPATVKSGCIVFTETENVNVSTNPYAEFHVTYSDNTYITLATITELNKPYYFETNVNKTVSSYDFKLYRSDSALANNVSSMWNVLCIEGKTIDQKFTDAYDYIDARQRFNETVTGSKYVLDKTYTDTGTAKTVWLPNELPADISDPYVMVTNVTGLNNPDNILYAYVEYSNGTSDNTYIPDTGKWYPVYINKNKTVTIIRLVGIRSNETMGSATVSSWSVCVSDGSIQKVYDEFNERFYKDEINKNAIAKNICNAIYSNKSNGTFYGFESVEYVAKTTSENWQAASYTTPINVTVGANQLISFGCFERDGLGRLYAAITFHRSEGRADATYEATSANVRINEFGGFVHTVYSPSNTVSADITFYGISNATAQGQASVIGHTYKVENAFVYVGSYIGLDETAMAISWESAIETIKTNQESKFIIGIQTDTHYFNGCSNVIGKNLNQLSGYVAMDCIANLGDIIQGYADDTNTTMRESMTEIVKRYCDGASCPVALLLGNHDSNSMYASTHSEDEFSFGELFARITKPTINTSHFIGIENGKMYYYMDFPALRMIVLNTNDGTTPHDFKISDAQLMWLEETALDTDKPILVLSHVPLKSGIIDNYDSSYATVLSKLNTFKTNGGTVLACFFGHVHSQTSAYDDYGILHVGFTWSGGFAGQDTAEIAMIDVGNSTINTYGFGNASNRTFTIS